jgi:hypothetical protein
MIQFLLRHGKENCLINKLSKGVLETLVMHQLGAFGEVIRGMSTHKGEFDAMYSEGY